MASLLYDCQNWTVSLNATNLLEPGDATSGRPFNLPRQAHLIGEKQFVEGASVALRDKGNTSHDTSFTMVREEASESAARAAMAAHVIALQDIGHGNALMTHGDGTGVRYAQAALVDATPIIDEETLENARQWGMTYTLRLGRASAYALAKEVLPLPQSGSYAASDVVLTLAPDGTDDPSTMNGTIVAFANNAVFGGTWGSAHPDLWYEVSGSTRRIRWRNNPTFADLKSYLADLGGELQLTSEALNRPIEIGFANITFTDGTP